ncbi:DUF1028 domain-containing protein [Halobaculum sp. CBA1158]|uniref:DUF1028 domain-containing protein n=1 Tax=Halobaculum sp. CBA1158 TaxID=2904243 RepID=UPI001F27FE06|nr:DUF1028 domain-containing protein [Halobaculum sp. CBA1158]UIO99773.1 DUF1028 domain-containing protein [Halobaculum sp. CBA1158]
MGERNKDEYRTDGFVPGTFSISAHDPEADEFGVAVSTALVGVGALCPFVSENAAVATQSFVNVSHGANAVDMADRGVSVPTACDALLEDDEHASYRQLHGIDADGRTFAFSGDDCVDWYGHLERDDHTVAGNMLDNGDVIEEISETFTEAEGELAERLMTALEAGQGAGGDKRGKISAALLVHSPDPKLYHNLRIDNSDDPVGDLREAFELGKQTERDLPASTDEMLGEYPDEILDFGLKY